MLRKAAEESLCMMRRTVEESLCMIDRKLNTIYITGDITANMASKFRKYMRSLEVNGKPIVIEINSQGGSMEAGLMMCDTVELCSSEVTTRVTGEACSMAAVLLASGKTREALPSSTVMIHQGKFWLNAVPHVGLQTEVSELERVAQLVWDRLDTRTNKDSGFWKAECGPKNVYLNSAQALALKVIDRIVQRS